MNVKRFALIFVVFCLALSLAACSKKCSNGCGNAANSQCLAGMCDKCCDYWAGLNGCYKGH